MLFSSLTFIFYFLTCCIICYFIIPKKYKKIKNFILLLFSLIFYSWGEPKYILVMLITILVSYIFGLLIAHFNIKKNNKAKLILFIISIILILSSLFYFKYINFFIENINNIFKINIKSQNIILPIGISFYTFQILSYIIDLYRGKIKVQKNILDLSLYISFFPQLIAGPIVTYETIENQLYERKESLDKIISGIERFIIGLGKKIIIANNMAIIADSVFNSLILDKLPSFILILGVIAYTFQIYFDFSGYSDMAIGLGKIFGFEFLENFNYPYISKSITEFWKRWHISLTTFFREYLYIPLGGNRVKKYRWIFNMFIVWLLTGFWHGAAWTFIIWGLYYFILLILEKTILKNILNKIPNFLKFILTFTLINVGWVIFRANNINDIFIIIKNIFYNSSSIPITEFLNNNINIISALPYIIFAIIFSNNIMLKINTKLENNKLYNIVRKIVIITIFLICICFLVSSQYNPFIYFRF